MDYPVGSRWICTGPSPLEVQLCCLVDCSCGCPPNVFRIARSHCHLSNAKSAGVFLLLSNSIYRKSPQARSKSTAQPIVVRMVASPGQVAACSLLLFAIPVSAKTATTDVELDTWLSNTGPLTTTFTPAPSCFTERRTKIEYKGAYPDLEVGCEGPGGNECCPDRWASGRYFSPGMCPSGYQACTLPTTRQRQETTNMCCPKYVIRRFHPQNYCLSLRYH